MIGLVKIQVLLLTLAFVSASCLGPEAGPSVLDLEGRRVEPLASSGLQVFVFLRTDCPIANRYAPELRRLHGSWSKQGVSLSLVYPDKDETPASIREHLASFGLSIPALRDPSHEFVALAGATVTPEAAVYQGGELRYRGRIDDRFVDFGKTRAEPSRRDLEWAVAALLAGRNVEPARTEAVGCFLGDLP